MKQKGQAHTRDGFSAPIGKSIYHRTNEDWNATDLRILVEQVQNWAAIAQSIDKCPALVKEKWLKIEHCYADCKWQ
jgi:hypothetical protein